MARVVTLAWKRFRLPLCQAVATARGEALTHREGFLIRVEFEDGLVGFGEASPLPGWSQESPDEVEKALRAWPAQNQWPPSVEFAMESARSAWVPERPRVAVALCGLATRVEELANMGCPSVKLKLPGEGKAAREAVRKARELLPAGTRLRLDANRRFPMAEALAIAREAGEDILEFFEEPTFEIEKLREWPRRIGVPLAVDETLRECGAGHPACQAASIFVIKPTLTGGWQRCLELAAMGKAVVISSSWESQVGLFALGELAARMPEPRMAAGLDTWHALGGATATGLPWESCSFRAGGTPPRVPWDELDR